MRFVSETCGGGAPDLHALPGDHQGQEPRGCGA